MSHIVVDIETKRMHTEVEGGFANPAGFGLACAVVFDYGTQRFELYGSHEDAVLEEHIELLRRRLCEAERVTCWNGWMFDLPIIFETIDCHVTHDWVGEMIGRVDDLYLRVLHAAGVSPEDALRRHPGISLHKVGEATLSKGKRHVSEDAPRAYAENRWADLFAACMDHVALAAELERIADRWHLFCIPKEHNEQVPSSERWPSELKLSTDWRLPLMLPAWHALRPENRKGVDCSRVTSELPDDDVRS